MAGYLVANRHNYQSPGGAAARQAEGRFYAPPQPIPQRGKSHLVKNFVIVAQPSPAIIVWGALDAAIRAQTDTVPVDITWSASNTASTLVSAASDCLDLTWLSLDAGTLLEVDRSATVTWASLDASTLLVVSGVADVTWIATTAIIPFGQATPAEITWVGVTAVFDGISCKCAVPEPPTLRQNVADTIERKPCPIPTGGSDAFYDALIRITRVN